MRYKSKLPVSAGWVGHKGPLGKNGMWTHPDHPNACVKHCGHATANRPYYVPGSYYTFIVLKHAQWWVEREGYTLDVEADAIELYSEMLLLESGGCVSE
jgi:hypothetical protein